MAESRTRFRLLMRATRETKAERWVQVVGPVRFTVFAMSAIDIRAENIHGAVLDNAWGGGETAAELGERV